MDRTLPCPQCAAVVVQIEGAWPATFPFCSERCRLVDLGRWLREEYRVPASEPPEEDEPSE